MQRCAHHLDFAIARNRQPTGTRRDLALGDLENAQIVQLIGAAEDCAQAEPDQAEAALRTSNIETDFSAIEMLAGSITQSEP